MRKKASSGLAHLWYVSSTHMTRQTIIHTFAILTALVLLSATARAGEPVTIVGDANYAPYSYDHGGQPTGIYVEILRRAFSRMPDFDVTIRMLPWKRALATVEAGKALAVFPPYRLDMQRPYISPYSTQILKEEEIAVCSPDSLPDKTDPVWPRDYQHLTFTMNAGFELGGEEFLKAKKSGEIHVIEVKNAEAALLMLIRNHADCYINDRHSIYWAFSALRVRDMTQKNAIKEVAVIKTQYGHLGYARQSEVRGKDLFVRQFDAVIAAMKRSGEIDVIVDDYLKNASGYDFDD